MKEKDVEKAVVTHLKGSGLLTFPDSDKRWGKFKILDEHSEPDVVGFKWEDDYSLLIKAVECKGKGTLGSVRSALDQAKIYQCHFPWCYISTERASKFSLKDFEFLNKAYHIGYIPVEGGDPPKVMKKVLDVFPKYINTNLHHPSFRITRQKIVTFSTFLDVCGDSIRVYFEGNNFSFNTLGHFQYNANNYTLNRATRFGINIEKKSSVMRKLKGNVAAIVKAAKDLQFNDFILEFQREQYSDLRPRAAMEVPTIIKPVKNIGSDDAKYMERKMRNWDYQVHFILQKEIWSENEFLSRKEHIERMEEARKLVESLGKETGLQR